MIWCTIHICQDPHRAPLNRAACSAPYSLEHYTCATSYFRYHIDHVPEGYILCPRCLELLPMAELAETAL